jgi:CDP-ribitol ribitolphosphotransferase / teichoic acid ribitol-phosphate polymerase
MKFILFCNLPYAFAILKPLEEEIKSRDFDCLWYVPKNIVTKFPYKQSDFTSSIKELQAYQSDVIFVPGNEVPYFLRGIKVQIFHGLAGEKKGHFRIRDYFDLYLTQGPYFTNKFKELATKHENFTVMETGWCKLDELFTRTTEIANVKKSLLSEYNVEHIVLYAPTFSPSLTSGVNLLYEIEKLANREDILLIIKFHDRMDKGVIQEYQNLNCKNLIISDKKSITELLQISDLMISDTSSVVYEFIFLDKPVVTLNSQSENINWVDVADADEVENSVINILSGDDKFKDNRDKTIQEYHPYSDGKSAFRMINAVIEYKERYGVPNERKVSFLRKLKIHKIYLD